MAKAASVLLACGHLFHFKWALITVAIIPFSMIAIGCMVNPFQFGRELGMDSLVGRKEELAAVRHALTDGSKLFLVGPRRFGKTSLLKSAADELTAEGAIIVRLDAESYPGLDLLAAAIVTAAATSLKGEVAWVGEQVEKSFARLRPRLNYSVADGKWGVRFGVDSAETSDAVLLVDALNGFEKLAQSQPKGQPVGLILDEFQRVLEIGGRDAEGQIRAAIQTHSRIGYVFAGSKTRMLHDMLMDPVRPFYRLGTNLFLQPVARKDFEKYLTQAFVASGFQVDNAAIDLIMTLAEDVPFNVQMLANRCWADGKDSSRKPMLSTAAVQASLETLVRELDPFFSHLWNGLTSIQQRTLTAVVAERGENMQSFRVSRAVGFGTGTIRKSLLAMVSMSLLREAQATEKNTYRFEDPFFAYWIRLTTGVTLSRRPHPCDQQYRRNRRHLDSKTAWA